MRFRLATIADIPACTKLYADFLREEPPLYPTHQSVDAAALEWATHQCIQLTTNQAGYFCIVGVVKSQMIDNQVVGGAVKAMITVFLTTRPIGNPKAIGFVEMLVVDPRFRKHTNAKKIALFAAAYARARGAQVFEASWRSGSMVGQLWKKAGMTPYQEYGAWILADGSPKEELPYAADLLPATQAGKMDAKDGPGPK